MVSSERLTSKGRLSRYPEIPLALQSYKIQFLTVNFLYGISQQKQDRLSLLQKPFNINISYNYLLYSELLEKIDLKNLDASKDIKILFEPVRLILPQAVYTYILKCNDLNFGWSDRMQAEFYCVKWIHMSEYYKQLSNVISQSYNIEIPHLSLTLKHTDGSFISELLLRQFDF